MQGSVGLKWFDGKWLLRHLLVLWGRYRGDSVGGCREPAFAWFYRFHYMKGSEKSGDWGISKTSLHKVRCRARVALSQGSGYLSLAVCVFFLLLWVQSTWKMSTSYPDVSPAVPPSLLRLMIFCVHIGDFRGYIFVDTCPRSWPADELHEEMISMSGL